MLVSAYHAWRYKRNRRICKQCRACGSEMETESAQLLSQGYHRAAVFTRRLQLELHLSGMVQRVLNEGFNEGKPATRTTSSMVPFLKYHGRMTAKAGKRVNSVYAQASRVIHGGPCNIDRAMQIINAIDEVIESLAEAAIRQDESTRQERKLIIGFAQAAGGVA